MPDLVYNVKFNIDQPTQKSVAGDMGRDAQQAASQFDRLTNETRLQSEMLEKYNNIVRTNGKLTQKQKLGYEKTIRTLRIMQKQLLMAGDATENLSAQQLAGLNRTISRSNKVLGTANSHFNGLGNSMAGVNKIGNNSNQILLSFGDALQDSAQFSQGFSAGMRAVGNNLTFAAEQFLYAAQQAGGYKNALRTMMRQFIGPVGIIVGFNAAVTAVTVFTQSIERSLKKVREEGKETSEIYKELAKTFVEATSVGVADPFGLRKISREAKFVRGQLEGLSDPLEDYAETLRQRAAERVDVSLPEFLQLGLPTLISGFGATFLPEFTKNLIEFRAEVRATGKSLDNLFQEDPDAFQESFAKIVRQSAAFEELQLEVEKAELKEKAYRNFLNQNPVLKQVQDDFDSYAETLRNGILTIEGLESANEDLIGTVTDYGSDSVLGRILNLTQKKGVLDENQIIALQQYQSEYDSLAASIHKVADAQSRSIELLDRERTLGAELAVLQAERSGASAKEAAAIDAARAARQAETRDINQRFDASIRQINSDLAANRISEDTAESQAATAGRVLQAELDLADQREANAIRQAELNKVISDAGVVQSLAQTTAVLGQIFGASKEMQIAMAVIDGGAAIVKTFAQLGFPAGIPAALAVAAKTAQTISQMKSVKPGDSKAIDGSYQTPSSQAASPIQRGFSEVESPAYLPGASRTRGEGTMAQVIFVQDETGTSLRTIGAVETAGANTVSLESNENG